MSASLRRSMAWTLRQDDRLAFRATEHELELIGFDDEHIARSRMNHSIRSVPDRESLQTAPADRAHHQELRIEPCGDIWKRALGQAAEHVHVAGRNAISLDLAVHLLACFLANGCAGLAATVERISGIWHTVGRVKAYAQLLCQHRSRIQKHRIE